jgi:hypothetical protein
MTRFITSGLRSKTIEQPPRLTVLQHGGIHRAAFYLFHLQVGC